jgi:hypothetical protein
MIIKITKKKVGHFLIEPPGIGRVHDYALFWQGLQSMYTAAAWLLSLVKLQVTGERARGI